MTEEAASALQNLRDAFTKYKASNLFITEPENDAQLCHIIRTAFDERTIEKAIILGPRGSGKKKAVQYAVSKCNVTRFIAINCLIYNTPILVYERLLRECECEDVELSQSLKSKIKSNDRIMESWLRLLAPFFDRNNAVVYFSNFEKINKQRQSFFYTLLDGIGRNAPKCVLFFSTPSLVFQETLDKRIKSRFTNNLVYFGLDPLASVRFLKKCIENSVECPQIAENLKGIIENEPLKTKIVRFYELTQSYRMLMTLFGGIFCLLSPRDLVVQGMGGSMAVQTLDRAFEKSRQNLVEANHARIVDSLPNCHRVILRLLLKNGEHCSGPPSMKMIFLLSQIQNRQHQIEQAIPHKYDQASTFNAVLDLVALRYLVVKPFPISQFSEVIFVGDPAFRSIPSLTE